jgi:hypothetical protein
MTKVVEEMTTLVGEMMLVVVMPTHSVVEETTQEVEETMQVEMPIRLGVEMMQEGETMLPVVTLTHLEAAMMQVAMLVEEQQQQETPLEVM